jgi:gas vesicle protein
MAKQEKGNKPTLMDIILGVFIGLAVGFFVVLLLA